MRTGSLVDIFIRAIWKWLLLLAQKKKRKKEKITINLRKIYNYKLGNSRNVTTLLKKKKTSINDSLSVFHENDK